MATYLDQIGAAEIESPPQEDNETNTLVSILSGIGSGLFKIPEG